MLSLSQLDFFHFRAASLLQSIFWQFRLEMQVVNYRLEFEISSVQKHRSEEGVEADVLW